MKYNIIILLFWSCLLQAQTKNEKEERIPDFQFPKPAYNYFNNTKKPLKRLKFFKEIDGKNKSYEAKFKYNKLHYSVEFDTLGKLEDIEIIIKQKHIPEGALQQITTYFKTNFDKYSFIKIQEQYINKTTKTDTDFINYILENPIGKHTHFEIIAEIKSEKDRLFKEFTFKFTGEFEKSRPISSSSYEHALF
ncbi:hypothetical protein [Neotamlana laminarinivorans]|uniref:Uncharacterized protein n=1 Tax=Neotamlana laminarinivorans TaxID=2883124 RepID=A0A9X1I1P8_9FLAO|nr:hypothetical protein [Tamlana laminarinivorans]MCB4799801.1 hypothetical protein [Tamlana laminarinivorans]